MGERTITDAAGKTLLLRDLDVVEELDLYEVAAANSTNPAWLGTAMMVCTVRAINGSSQPFPRTQDQVKAALTRIGRDGITAVRKNEREEAAAEAARVAADLLVATQAPGAINPENALAKN
jgi:hypothetical protein